jgi:hypothetical protein
VSNTEDRRQGTNSSINCVSRAVTLETMSNRVQNLLSAPFAANHSSNGSFPMWRNRSRRPPTFIRIAPLDENTFLLIDATIDQLIRVAPRAGLSIHDLNKLLDSGMELDELVDCIAATVLKRAA